MKCTRKQNTEGNGTFSSSRLTIRNHENALNLNLYLYKIYNTASHFHCILLSFLVVVFRLYKEIKDICLMVLTTYAEKKSKQ